MVKNSPSTFKRREQSSTRSKNKKSNYNSSANSSSTRVTLRKKKQLVTSRNFERLNNASYLSNRSGTKYEGIELPILSDIDEESLAANIQSARTTFSPNLGTSKLLMVLGLDFLNIYKVLDFTNIVIF